MLHLSGDAMSYMNKKASYLLFRQQGLGLVELLISITLSLVIMAGVIQLFASSAQTSRTNQAASRIQENVRYAIKRIGDDIAKAGSLGCFSYASAPDDYIYNELLNVNAGTWNDFTSSFISGVNADADAANAIVDGTDTLIIKYADLSNSLRVIGASDVDEIEVEDASDVGDGSLIMAGNCQNMSVFTVNSDGVDTLTLLNGESSILKIANSDAFVYTGNTGAHEYYIGDSVAAINAGDTCSAQQRGNCSLYRASNGGNGQELVEGVHGMTVSYSSDGLNYGLVADLNVQRVQIVLQFNAQQAAGNLLTKTVTRVFAVRNQL